jgi:aconitate hydratase
LQFLEGESIATLGLSGHEVLEIVGVAGTDPADLVGRELAVRAGDKYFRVKLRIDTPSEADYLAHGGILAYVARQLANGGG